MEETIRIVDIDKNFKVETELDLPNLKFYDPRLEPFTIYGVFYEDGQYRRMPDKIAKSVNPANVTPHSNPASTSFASFFSL